MTNSTLIRVHHNKENPFVQLNKKALWDSNLSLKAIGLWARCLSRPDNWEFSVSELSKSCKEGSRSLYAAINELIANNYAVRIQTQKLLPNGKPSFDKLIYVFFEFKITEEEKAEYLEEFKKCFPLCCFALPQNATQLIKSSTNTDRKKKKKKEKEGVPPTPPAHPTSPKIKRRDHVNTTAQEHSHLLELHSPEKVEVFYDTLNEWKEDTPRSKWKKNDSRSILRWVVDAVDEKAKRKGETNAPIDNRAYAEKIAKNYNLSVGPRKQVRLTILGDRLEIVSTCPTASILPTTIRYKENGFVDQVETALRKWRLK